MESTEGLVVRSVSGYYTVITPQGSQVTCRLRGRLKHAAPRSDIVAVGDRVKITCGADGTGSIENVEERQRALVRLAPTPKGEYRQVLLANPDQLVLVFACAHPEPHLRMLDRFLVIAEKQGLPALIIANKLDLVTQEEAEATFGHYPGIGYPVIYTSVRSGAGLVDLKNSLSQKLSAFSGPSGVGKSSLLNAIQPQLGLAVSDVSRVTHKGRHTTTIREMFRLDAGGYVVDMPGIKSLALWDTQPEELDGYFPELRPLVEQCQFSDCTHRREPGCAVRNALEDGRVHPQRYRSYLRLRYGESIDS